MSRRLVASFLALTLLVLLVLELPLGFTFANHERDQLRTEVERDAVVLSTLVEESLQEGAAIDRTVIDRFVERTNARVVVTDRVGIAVIDTDAPAQGTRSFASRPEIASALAGRVASGTRHSDTLGADFLYVAVPVASAGRVYGTVRVSFPQSKVDARVARYWWTLAAVGATSLAAATFTGMVLARSVSRPLRRLSDAAARIGRGDLSARAHTDTGPPVVRALGDSFDDMAARLEELVDAQDAFVADASHQLRNPLAALRLRIENLASEVGRDAQEDVSGALAEVTRLSRLVDGLLALARADRAGVRPPDEAIDVVPLLEERRTTWAPLAEERGICMELSTASAHLPAIVTADRFRQVLDNVLANALDAAECSTVMVTASQHDSTVHVHVIDDGVGMSEDQRARAFDRFWSGAAPDSRFGGSGLGLAIVRKLVLADGGDVDLDEAPGGGLDVGFRFRAGPAM